MRKFDIISAFLFASSRLAKELDQWEADGQGDPEAAFKVFNVTWCVLLASTPRKVSNLYKEEFDSHSEYLAIFYFGG